MPLCMLEMPRLPSTNSGVQERMTLAELTHNSWFESLGARAIARAAGVNRTLPASQFWRLLSLILAAPVLDPCRCFVLLGLILANLVARSGLPKRQTSAAGVNDFAAPSRPIGLLRESWTGWEGRWDETEKCERSP